MSTISSWLTRSSSIESGVGIKDVEEETDRVQQTRVRQAIGFFKRERLDVFREKGGYRAYVMLKIKVDEARRLTDNKKDNGSREEKFDNLNQPTVEVNPIWRQLLLLEYPAKTVRTWPNSF